MGKQEACEVQCAVAPNSIGLDSDGNPIKDGMFLSYTRGEKTPSDRLVAQIEQQVRRSAWRLSHPLWQVLWA